MPEWQKTQDLQYASADDIRVGTVGTGRIVHNVLSAMENAGGFVLSAVYSRSESRAQAICDAHHGGRIYTEYGEMLSDPEVDLVYIASPNALHFEQARMALEAGKHVLLEKPMCPRLREAEALYDLALRKGRILLEAIPTPYLPHFWGIQEEVKKLGRIRLVMANYSQYSSRYDELRQGRMTNIFDPQMAGGCLMDINYYNIYLTAALFGLPETVRCRANFWQNVADTSETVHLQYPDFQAVLLGAKDARGECFYQIEGEDGTLYVEDGSNGLKTLKLIYPDRTGYSQLQMEPNRYRYEAEMVGKIVRDGQLPHDLMQCSLQALTILEEARRDAGILFPGDEK